jgi:hypothetical protein
MGKVLKGRRPSPAMIIALIALFAAVGAGTVYAAHKTSGKTIKKNSLPGNRVKKGSLTTKQVKDGSLTAADLNAATLTPTCPSDTRLAEGVCFETTPRGTTTYDGANDTCVDAGRRLPSAAELSGFTRRVQAIPAQERSGDLFAATTSFNVNPNGTFATVAFATATAFRCVAAPAP